MRIFRLLNAAGNDIQGNNHRPREQARRLGEGLKRQGRPDRIAHLGIETRYNGAWKRGNERVISGKQLGDDSRRLGINSEKAMGTRQQNGRGKKLPMVV